MIAKARCLAAYLLIALCVLLAGTPALLLSILTSNPKLLFKMGRIIIRLGLLLVGVRFSVTGQEKVLAGKNYVFISNHISNLDPLVLLLSIPRDLRFIAKKELSAIPLVSKAMLLANFVFVDRRKREAAQIAVDRAADLLRKGLSFFVFPEGTRSQNGELQAFKKGAFVLSIKGGVDIIPVVLQGSHLSMPKGRWAVKPGRILVTILDPISTEDLTYIDRDRLLEKAHNVMAQALLGKVV